MSADMPERSDAPDDLARAYAQANALADDGRGPSARVRDNVLAAARDVAAEAASRVAGEAGAARPLTPVAPPVADVGRGRPKAINLSSWRVRSGAALAAMLLVGLAGWRFDAARRFNDGEQVAMAELRMAAPPTSRMPGELPVPPISGASTPYMPPPTVDDSADGAGRPAAKQARRDKDVIVAQLDQPADRLARAAPPAAAVAPARQPQPPARPAPTAADAGTPAPVVVASSVPDARAPVPDQDPATVTITAAPTQFATESAKLPSVLPRRVAVVPAAPAPAPASDAPPEGATAVAAAEPGRQQGEAEASRLAFSGPGVGGGALKKIGRAHV